MTPEINTVELTGNSLTIDEVVAVARHGATVNPLSGKIRERIQASRQWLEATLQQEGAVIYGINTGFGPLASQKIELAEMRLLSRNVILACITGVGEPLAADAVRAMMVTRANTFALGYSAVRPILVDTLIQMINAGIVPYVPSKGSLGASGDLAPLAHIAVMLSRDPEGEGGFSGRAWYEGQLLDGAQAMSRAGIERIVLESKEGLSLTNGTTMMVAMGALGVFDAANLLRHAHIAAALSLEALQGVSSAFAAPLHEANQQPGQIYSAATIRRLIHGSRLIDSAADKVQDAYSLRCTPQVLGPAQDALDFIALRMTAALRAAADNPLVFVDHADPASPAAKGRVVSGGNFHGQGPAMWHDFLGIGLAEVGSIAERRIFRMLTPELSGDLPSMLVPSSGLDSGLMMPQYTAAALVSDNKTLAHPDSVDSIPSSGNQEDHVSMGANAARHASEILDNLRQILAIEMLTAAQAIDLRPDGPARLGEGTRIAYQMIRERVETIVHDRQLTPDIDGLAELIAGGEMAEAIARETGLEYE
jgi:histidine ammonia-lyase